MAIQREPARRCDAEIDFDVCETLRWDMRIDDSNILVEVSDGHVRLLGKVLSWSERLWAAEDAARIKGVCTVQNELAIEPEVLRRDEDIARDVRGALNRDRRLDVDRIEVVVHKGIVTLKGEVRTVAERRAAMEAVWYTAGLVDMVDELRVVPVSSRPDAQIASDVRTVLLVTDGILDPLRIGAEVKGGTVYLRGGVEHELERHTVLAAARLVAGVVDVIDELVIAPLA